ncbi:uncharacterized protein LOC134283789 [Saccostrea cucullata]|uniref:uncharacterized protein LOC134283789 n=1 Tax=Saccostrea cuccullata TaxID=36930 RepID=UPI002ED15908
MLFLARTLLILYISSVMSCPRNEDEYNNAVKRKRCQAKPHPCASFEYHCVLNDWMNDTIEVCAPSSLIVGGICAEFNLDEMSIRGSFLTNCTAFNTPCPQAYKSTKSYKYSDCYFNIRKVLSSEKRNCTSRDG